MFCGKCGYEIRGEAKFCPKCGADVKMPDAAQTPSVPTYTEDNPRMVAADDHVRQSQQEYYGEPQPPAANGYGYESPRSKPQPKQQKPPQRSTGGQIALSILICVFIYIFTSAAFSVIVTRTALSEDSVRGAAKSGEITSITVDKDGKLVALSEYIVSNINSKLVSKNDITSKKVDSVLRSDRVKKLIEDLAVDFTGMFVFGKEPVHLYEDKIMDDIESLDAVVYREIGYHFTDKDYSDIKNDLQKNGKLSFLVKDNIKSFFGGVEPTVFSAMFSVPVIIVCVVIDLVLLFLLFLVNKRRVKLPFLILGITFMVFGVGCLFESLAAAILSSVFNIYIVSGVLGSFSIPLLIIGLIFATTGAVMFIIQLKIRKRDNAYIKRMKEQAA